MHSVQTIPLYWMEDEYTANLQPLLYTLGQIITNTVNGLDFYQVDRSGGLLQTEI